MTKIKVVKEAFYNGVVQDVGNVVDYEDKKVPSWAEPAENIAPKLKGVQVQKTNTPKKPKVDNPQTSQETEQTGSQSNMQNDTELAAELESLKDKAISLGIAYDDTDIAPEIALNQLKEIIAQKEQQG